MAFSAVTHRGFGFEKLSDLTWVISPASNIVVGKIAFVHAVTDNTATTSGATTTHTSIVDNADGNAWAKVYERTAPGTPAAGTGTTHSLWWKKIATQIGTGNTITLTVTANAAAKSINVFEATITGSTIQLADDGTPEGFQEGSATSASVATSGMTSQEYLHIGCLARESDTTTYTADADYTNLTSPAGQVTTGGGAATNQGSFVATRIATLTGDTWAVSWTGTTDIAAALVAFEEVVGDQPLTGALFTSAPTFFTGAIVPSGELVGVLYVNAPTFFAGAVIFDQALTGTLYADPPSFFTGRVHRTVPANLLTDEIGVMGHSSVGTIVDWYRTISTSDLLTNISHGGTDAKVWGDPAAPGYAAAWAKLDDDQPVGGFRAFWIMLGFLENYSENQAQREAWADHIYTRLMTDFPTIRYIWWSPMTTQFSTSGIDGDAEDLVALDRWGANPTSLDEWVGAALIVSAEQSWELTAYAYEQGYADDYGPWINLTEDITDPDNRHPSEAAGGDPAPNGQTHGGDILLAFFEGGALGLTGTLLVATPTFFVGTVTAGAVALTGTLYVNAATFFVGDITPGIDLAGALYSNPPTFFTGTLLVTVSQRPDATVSNVGWDTAPTPGQLIHTHIAADDSDYITVTV